jgi:hypothetical protein
MLQRSIPVTRWIVLLLTILLGMSWVLTENSVQAQVLRWEIEATVVDIDDPDMIFTNVRLGDPVRGFLSYDLATQPSGIGDEGFDVYWHDTQTFAVAAMVIENPREGTEMTLVPIAADIADVYVFNDAEDDDHVIYDNVSAYQGVIPPPGFRGDAPMVAVDLYGPPGVLTSASLPTELDLNDWPDATIGVVDYYDLLLGSDDPAGYIAAEIHTLTPVDVLNGPGDYNHDGTVDAADYVVWRDGLGTNYTQADYGVWRANFGATSTPNPAAGVPEPTSVAIALLAIIPLLLVCRALHPGLPGWKHVCKPEIPTHHATRPRPACLGGAMFEILRGRETPSHAVKLRVDETTFAIAGLVSKQRATEQAPVVPNRHIA